MQRLGEPKYLIIGDLGKNTTALHGSFTRGFHCTTGLLVDGHFRVPPSVSNYCCRAFVRSQLDQSSGVAMAHNRYNPPVEAEARFSVVYFGYGSNLSPRTLKQRCPDSLFIGLARLEDYRWQINSTGYANIAPSAGDHVHGSLSFLSNRDETALDESEGVPWLYEKHTVRVTRCGLGVVESEGDGEAASLDAMTYVDVQRVEDGVINKEYVYWMNKAIEDAAKCEMPASYADKYLRPFVPERPGEPDIMMVRTMIPKTLTPRAMPKGLAPVQPR